MPERVERLAGEARDGEKAANSSQWLSALNITNTESIHVAPMIAATRIVELKVTFEKLSLS
eukprot:5649194-Amphidinium_carterae.1